MRKEEATVMLPENPLISVIVPVYKVERFLDRCVESLCAQSYSNLEIILVDDGSPDGCPQLCDAWAARDSRVKVLHKPNGGLSDARNHGVAIARGDYISFVDSDDYVSCDYVEYLFTLLQENGADISCGSFRTVHGGGELFEDQPPEQVERFDHVSACRELMDEAHYMRLVTAWAKLFTRTIVVDNPFPVGRLHEDEATTYKYYYQSGSTVIGTREIYAYYQNDKSITHTKKRENTEATILAFEERFRYFGEQGSSELQLAAARRLLSDLIYQASGGNEPCREFLKAGRGRAYLLPGLDLKIKLRYYAYALLGVDPTELSRRVKGK